MTPYPGIFRFWLETPNGDLLTPAVAAGTPGVEFTVAGTSTFYRFTLPSPIAKGADIGRWRAHLEVDEEVLKKIASSLDKLPKLLRELISNGARYCLNVHSLSNLRLKAALHQNSNEPGTVFTLRADLKEYGIPVENRSAVRAKLERPDRSKTTITLSEVEPGVFETTIPAALSGVYHFRLLASGVTLRGQPFTREHLVTGAVWRGGDQPIPAPTEDDDQDRVEFCKLLECLLSDKTIRPELQKKLEAWGLDINAIRQCVTRYCHRKTVNITDLELVFQPKFMAEMQAFLHKPDG